MTHNTEIFSKILLFDLRLQKVDAVEVLRRVRADEQTKSMPIAMLTLPHDDCDQIASYNLGVNNYAVKPVRFESFSMAIADLGLY